MMQNGNEVKKIIDSPDDLFKVGWSEEYSLEPAIVLLDYFSMWNMLCEQA